MNFLVNLQILMIKLINRFKEACKTKKKIGIRCKSFAETLYNFNFLLINSAFEINAEIEEEIEDKIKKSQDLVIREYEEKMKIIIKVIFLFV